MILYQGKFPTTRKLKSDIITIIKDKLFKIDGKICMDLLDLNLILDEAIVNAMEHGNKWDPSKNISINISLEGKEIQIEIEDEGQGFDYYHKFSENEIKPLLRERGRGLFLMKQFCEIEWTNCGNIIKISIPFELSA